MTGLTGLPAHPNGGYCTGNEVTPCLTLAPPPTRVPQSGTLALWRRVELSPGQLTRLGAHRDVERLVHGALSVEWPWQLSLVLRTTLRFEFEQLAALLREVGLDSAPDTSAPLLIDQPRDQARLFCTDD